MISIRRIKKEVKKKLSSDLKRYIHILGVLELSKKLAKKYNVPLYKMSIISLFHDYTKNESIETQCSYLPIDIVNLYKNRPSVYHAYSATIKLKKIFKINDKIIVDAINSHVLGNINMSIYAKILFISDVSEKNRKYEGPKKVRELAFINLDSALVTAFEYKIENAIKKGNIVDNNQIQALEYYKKQIQNKEKENVK